MLRVIHFELPAQDPARAARFYSEVFGWESQKWDGPMDYYLVSTGDQSLPGINGGLSQANESFPTNAPVNTIDVPSVDEYAAKIVASGGCIVVPKMAVPTIGYLAYAKDTEGVFFGIMEPDENAA